MPEQLPGLPERALPGRMEAPDGPGRAGRPLTGTHSSNKKQT